MVREFNGVIKTNFLGDEIPKESMHYTGIACITTDYLMRMGKTLSTSLFRLSANTNQRKQGRPNL